MAQPKRKRSNEDQEDTRPTASQTEKTRRVTRQTSIPPPVEMDKDSSAVAPRRRLRGSSSAAVDVDISSELATVRRSQVRTRRASKLSTDDVDVDEEDVAVEDHEEEGQETYPEEVRTTRSKAKAQEEVTEEEPQRRLRGGKTIEAEPPKRAGKAVASNTTGAKRVTRQAAKDVEIADSDEIGDEDDDEVDMVDAADDESIPDSAEEQGQSEQSQSEPEPEPEQPESDSSEASPPHTRRSKRTDVQAPTLVVPPLTPPHAAVTAPAAAATAVPEATVQPAKELRKEPAVKPSPVPIPVMPASPAAVQPPAARPKKVTEIKPPAAPPAPAPAPAPRQPVKTTPIQPPVLAAFAASTTSTKNSSTSNSNPSNQHPRQSAKSTIVTPTTAPRPSAMASMASKPAATSTPIPTSTTTSTTTTTKSKTSPASPSQPDRNIDKVVLGEICFKAWYPSYYGKEVLGDHAGNTHHGRGGHSSKGHPSKDKEKENLGSQHKEKEKDSTPILHRLYVCPFCFKYSREIVPWHGHVQVCESQFQIPGEKVYVHPRGVRTIRVPIPSNRNKRRKSGNAAPVGNANANANANTNESSSTSVSNSSAPDYNEYIEQVVKDEGEWSIWEVDGERDVLFCQNISLFAKLFLDTKSVFFDVTGFKYFLLVYTPPPSLPSSLRAAATATLSPMSGGAGGSGNGNGTGQPPASILGGAAPRPRVVGFFSKEKMSWDNNNLACILVFPPWQRKGLGALLMGISYEISRREGVLGGPEKPISDLGKKGYKRFWAGEIARWLLGVDIAQSDKDTASTRDELVIDIDDISEATWIVRDDCLYVLREMGIVEDAGLGPPKKYCDNVLPRLDKAKTAEPGDGEAASDEVAPPASATTTTATAAADTEPPPEVKRVRLSKAAIRQWIKDNRISLERTCDPAGFIKDYSPKEAPAEEV